MILKSFIPSVHIISDLKKKEEKRNKQKNVWWNDMVARFVGSPAWSTEKDIYKQTKKQL